MARVVVLGSSNTDMTVRVPYLPSPGQTILGGSFLTGPGGKGANQAVAARRAGAEVVFLTAVGDDLFGKQALDHYRSEGLDVSQVVVRSGESSGVALIFVDDEGENVIAVAPGANATLDPAAIDRLPDDLFDPEGVLLAGLEIPPETVARAVQRAYAAGMRVILNPAPAAPAILDLDILRFVDILTPNQIEACALARRPRGGSIEDARRAAEAFWEKGVSTVVVTLGSEGCLVVENGPHTAASRWMRPFPVEAVDTVGAGDAFNGALATAIAEGRALHDAAIWASAAAALAVTKPGAQSALPHRDAIDRLASTYVPD
jgi:ribokinase